VSTAQIIIIGNEILTGKYADQNGPYLIHRLRQIGVDVVGIHTIPDVIDTIAAHVRDARHGADWVFTTGGVGPTHDDVTMQAIAQALDVPLEPHLPLQERMQERFGQPLSEGFERMTHLPEGCELWWDAGISFPLVVCENVLVFPGVPFLLQRKFEAIAHRFEAEPVQTRRVVLDVRETAIALRLEEIQSNYPDVAIGSYPRRKETGRVVIITLEGRDTEALVACTEAISKTFAEHVIDAE
jgi:molybdenum cofactor synthesis domain-containing protein